MLDLKVSPSQVGGGEEALEFNVNGLANSTGIYLEGSLVHAWRVSIGSLVLPASDVRLEVAWLRDDLGVVLSPLW